MTRRTEKVRLTLNVIMAAKPGRVEYTLWDGVLAHLGLRVHPSGAKSFIVQTCVHGRMRKLTLGRFPEMGITEARKEAAALLARIWAGEVVAPVRKTKPPRFADFAARYRERRKHSWKPSTLETHDTYLAQPADAGLRPPQARYYRPCAGLGLVRRGQR